MNNNKISKKALVIAVNPTIRAVSKFVLSDYIKCAFIKSSPEGKHFLKASDDIRVLVLDWSIQDKYGSVLKCLKEAKARKNVLVVNIFASSEQKKYIINSLPNLAHNNKIYNITSDFMEISLTIALFKLKKRIYKKTNSSELK